jgi:hypothetical protein
MCACLLVRVGDERVAFRSGGTFERSGERTCACTVGGRSGTLEFKLTARGVFGVSYEGHVTVVDATGDLAGL